MPTLYIDDDRWNELERRRIALIIKRTKEVKRSDVIKVLLDHAFKCTDEDRLEKEIAELDDSVGGQKGLF